MDETIKGSTCCFAVFQGEEFQSANKKKKAVLFLFSAKAGSQFGAGRSSDYRDEGDDLIPVVFGSSRDGGSPLITEKERTIE